MKHQLLSIQYLRGIAAGMVVLHHACNPAAWLFNPLAGYGGLAHGVDIFFVLSGFIMYTAARNEPVGTFVWRRFIRVTPLYWLATALFLASLVTVKGRALDGPLMTHAVKSMLFVPHENLTEPGRIWPLLVPGWSLNYEMFFYAIFAVAIAFRRPLLISTAVIIALVCAGLVVRPTSPAGGVYTNLYLLQFLAGVWIGHLHQRHGFERWGALLPVGFVALLFAPGSKITLGLAASAVLIGALSMETRLPRIPLLKAIGDSSYSLYLFHVLALSMVSRAISPIKTLHGWPQFLVWIATSLTVSCALAVLIFRFFEKPLTSKLTRAQQPSRALA